MEQGVIQANGTAGLGSAVQTAATTATAAATGSTASTSTAAATAATGGAADVQQKALLEALRQLEVHNVDDEEEPQPMFRINGVEVLPRQAVGLVAGQRKNGKSNFAGLLMAACVAKERCLFDGAVRCLAEEVVKILYVDTEQPRHDCRRTLRRVMLSANYDRTESWDDHGIKVLSMKDIALEERLKAVEGAVNFYHPDLVIIDGLADLLRTINDENESRDLWQWLDLVACKMNCVVIGMLHQNHQSTKVGGWAGTQGVKKASDLFEVRKNREHNYFSVSHEGRGESAPKLQFFISCRLGDNVGQWMPMAAPLDILTKEDMERQEMQTLFADAPLPCTNTQLVRYVMDAKRYTSKSPADKLLSKAKKMGLLDSRKEGRNSIWFRAAPAVEETEMSFDEEEEEDIL